MRWKSRWPAWSIRSYRVRIPDLPARPSKVRLFCKKKNKNSNGIKFSLKMCVPKSESKMNSRWNKSYIFDLLYFIPTFFPFPPLLSPIFFSKSGYGTQNTLHIRYCPHPNRQSTINAPSPSFELQLIQRPRNPPHHTEFLFRSHYCSENCTFKNTWLRNQLVSWEFQTAR